MGKVVVFSDGKPGHVSQSLYVSRLWGTGEEIVEIRRSALGRVLDVLAVNMSVPLRADVPLEDTEIEFFVGAGATVVPYLVDAKKRYHKKAVVMMKPGGFPLGAFDLVIAPAHDFEEGFRRDNLVLTLFTPSHSFFEEGEVRAFRENVELDYSKKYVAVLVGGNSKWFAVTPEHVSEILRRVRKHWDGGILITTSRRTPPEVEKEVYRYAADVDYVARYSPYQPFNPVPGMISVAERVVVTSDSYTMISESVARDKFPFVFMVRDRVPGKNKFMRSFRKARLEGFLRFGGGEELVEYLEGKLPPSRGREYFESLNALVLGKLREMLSGEEKGRG